jgi:uncharacterized hydrophobic protein (TIGR00271 family)
MKNILDNFRLNNEKENHQTVIDSIDSGVVFKGTNLWILVFAIFIASLGLNVNSTAVIIGAMLVSPLMGPIMGLGLGLAINDLSLLKKALLNYLFAAGVGLATSTIYFLLSPINDAHSEILARTAPNIYDVLIALFGGLAGILATSSKQKGNVIPGVAIATALMPPLCTAGYGLATLQFYYFFGALYLFLINTVFIALSTLITLRFLEYPYKQLPNRKDEIKANRFVGVLVTLTLLPSIYFGYTLVQENEFKVKVNDFITQEINFKEDYLLNKTIDFENKSITLIFGGRRIKPEEIFAIKNKLKEYNLEGTKLEIKQGFASLGDINNNEQFKQMAGALQGMARELQNLRFKLDSLTTDTITTTKNSRLPKRARGSAKQNLK